MKQDVLIHGETIQENASHVDVIFILKNDINVTVRIVLIHPTDTDYKSARTTLALSTTRRIEDERIATTPVSHNSP
jgi:hypothetical protein